MSEAVHVEQLSGLDLAYWAARAAGGERVHGVRLGGRDPSRQVVLDEFDLIRAMSEAGELTMHAGRVTLSIPDRGAITFAGLLHEALAQCFIAWRLGETIDNAVT